LSPIKLEISSLTTLLLTGTTLWARIAIQGVELALLSTAIEACLKGIRAAKSLLRQYRELQPIGNHSL
jgi:biopolymer transport protein ExbB/TolQ